MISQPSQLIKSVAFFLLLCGVTLHPEDSQNECVAPSSAKRAALMAATELPRAGVTISLMSQASPTMLPNPARIRAPKSLNAMNQRKITLLLSSLSKDRPVSCHWFFPFSPLRVHVPVHTEAVTSGILHKHVPLRLADGRLDCLPSELPPECL